MKATICIPVLNQLRDAGGIMQLLRLNVSDQTEIMVIDNGSIDPVEDFFLKYIKPKRLNYIRNEQNVGLIRTMQQAYENCETEILIVVHNDVFIYEQDFDQRVIKEFINDPKLGIVGFFGSQGCGPNGERYQDVPIHLVNKQAAGKSNLLNAEVHGLRLKTPTNAVAILDGLFMAFNMKLLRETGGFDQTYQYHHYYDRDISLESLRRGYRNIVIDVPAHHLSGLTANAGDYQNWVSEQTALKRIDDERHGDKWVHDKNMETFNNKWSSVLPLYVEDNFSYRSGGPIGFKGDEITKLIK